MTYMGRLCLKGFLFQDRPFHFFFSPLEKKCLEIRKFAKFESDLLKTNEDIARPQSREILQTFVWWGVGDSLGPFFLVISSRVKCGSFLTDRL